MVVHRKNGHEPGDGVPAPRFVAASLQVEFIKPTPQGTALRVIGDITEIHPKRFQVNAQLFAEKTLCATGIVEAVMMPKNFGTISKCARSSAG